MAGRQQSTQVGAQDQGFAITGKTGSINTGTLITSTTQPQQAISGSANTVSYTTTQNGLGADALSQIFGVINKPSVSEVSAATPVALTPPASTVAVTGTNQSKMIYYGLLAVTGFFVFLLIRKFIK